MLQRWQQVWDHVWITSKNLFVCTQTNSMSWQCFVNWILQYIFFSNQPDYPPCPCSHSTTASACPQEPREAEESQRGSDRTYLRWQVQTPCLMNMQRFADPLAQMSLHFQSGPSRLALYIMVRYSRGRGGYRDSARLLCTKKIEGPSGEIVFQNREIIIQWMGGVVDA